MKTHLQYSDNELRFVKDIVKFWKAKGFVGTLNETNSKQGFVEISVDDWIKPSTREVIFRLHKIYAGSGFFGQKCLWVTEILTRLDGHVTKHGCVEGNNQVKALNRGVVQVGSGFPSRTKIEDYYFV